MKKIIYLLLFIFTSLILTGCGNSGNTITILNWGDYISSDVIKAFEEETGINVKLVTTDTNESMYSKILNRQAEYDIVVPSDYMIDQMATDGLIYELDYSKLSNYEEGMFVSELQTLFDSEDCKRYSGYFVPYFWGSLGIMYSTKKFSDLDQIVEEYGWRVLFERDILPTGCRVGMYNSSRDALAAAELYLGYSLNTTNLEQIEECMNLLSKTEFYAWGSDDLKLDIAAGKLDIALVYSGDFFDAYYSDLEAEGDESTNIKTYGIYAPKYHNNVFFDSLVIPKTSSNIDGAYAFINFMLDYDNSYDNSSFVGYCPTLQAVYDDIFEDEDFADVVEIDAYNPALIINEEGSKAEVYKFLGNDVYSFIEKKFTKVIFR
ncbi:MAG: extracellular solute-binding protein [Acholeplasmatales bacterium]|nr:extracellular solute-binding protein [Acholeplasmatales bacterium]